MKKKHAITITAVLAASMAMSVTAFGAPKDIHRIPSTSGWTKETSAAILTGLSARTT